MDCATRDIPNKLRAFPHPEFVDCSHHIGHIKHKGTMLLHIRRVLANPNFLYSKSKSTPLYSNLGHFYSL